MKNMSVGKKLLVGFGAVILLIVVILSVSVVTSVRRNSQLQYLNSIIDMQTEANSMLDDYNSVRVELRSVLSRSLNNDNEYNLMMEHMQAVKSRLVTMKTKSDALDGYGAPEIAHIDQALSEVEVGMDAVRASDLAIRAGNDTAVSFGETVTQEMAALHTGVLAFVGSADTPQAVQSRMESGMKPLGEIMQAFAEIRVRADDLLLGQDVSAMSDIGGNIDTIQQKLTGMRAVLTGATAESAARVSSALEDYRSELEALTEENAKNAALAGSTRTEFYEVLDELSDCVSTVSEEVTVALNGVVNSSNLVMFLLIGIAIFSIVFAVFIALYITRGITGPVGMMMDFLKQVGDTGNLNFDEEELRRARAAATARDEMGQSLAAFVKMLEHMVYYGETLQAVAGRDLTVDVETQGERDTMGTALKAMVANLNEMFSEIQSASAQVSTGSKQIADGAQALAQGATEQAAAVEQLSSSIGEIAHKTKENADMAAKAADLSENIRSSAEKGAGQMDQMMTAVREINESSQSINKVIKVIDDIAFQTNILALNAAVEAARAGQYGKGFAVVAEEVRSLAAKSAEAAKDTGALIEDSIEKAVLGAKIADETAASLTEIVAGINESTTIVGDIAKSSEEQSLAIQQINTGIDQVAQVVQQNSATAEESAASSEEMSGQSNMLSTLVSQFKLKGSTFQQPLLAYAGADGKEIPAAKEPNFGDDYGKY
ncbi:MAG: methyl-accepting chemotaxis protein [Oscillospiraceae bacterium]|jgi:methyl-accepting chemotaxis protein|nr:methyl-accepting chemotaxis protein [Oscillospiraceae bacterium]